jgi:predicted O-methyltransferase YrrM
MMLKDLFNKYDCDKHRKHRYDSVYQKLFEPLKDKPINFLEVGVFKGASTAAFHEFFPNATFYGLDLFVRVKPEDIEILNDERVNWLKADSTNPGVRTSIMKAFPGVKFDVILDDGLHTPKANRQTFDNLSPLLNDGGMYIIEDVWPLERMTMKQLEHPWIKRYPDRYNQLDNNMFLGSMEKSGLTINRHDMRKVSGQPDSYIIELS